MLTQSGITASSIDHPSVEPQSLVTVVSQNQDLIHTDTSRLTTIAPKSLKVILSLLRFTEFIRIINRVEKN